jgi:uncharacterized repeat protein (TIGR03837 family)
MPLRSIDVVCRVIDHLGDAGFCWRLARQLAAEHALSVRLWIDDVATLARISPVDAAQESQRVDGVVVRRLGEAAVPDALPDVVVAAFGCALPDAWLDAYVAAPVPPLWIHLEYLTAEAWIDDAHGLPSPPPRRAALRRWFFFPGFTDASGGLLRERGLLDARDAYRRRTDAREGAWRDAGLAPPARDELAVSLFCYPNPALPALLDAWAADPAPVRAIVPAGVATADLERWISGRAPGPGSVLTRRSLTLAIAPFVDQDAFDRRLWACDVNLVRGEDSFVRAQWAARPLVWQPYRQPERTHEAKLDAFLARYLHGAPPTEAEALAAFSRAFSAANGAAMARAWPALRRALAGLTAHAGQWAAALAGQTDLATRLVEFARFRL